MPGQNAQQLSFYDRQLRIDELRAAGKKKEADAEAKKLFIDQHSLELQKKFGLTQDEAVKRAERMHATLKAASGGHRGMNAFRMIGDPLDMLTGQQGWVMRAQQAGNLMHLIRAMPMLTLPALAATAVIGAIGFQKNQEAKDNQEQHRVNQNRLDSDLHFARTDRFGSSEQSLSEELDAGDQRKRLAEKRSELVDKAHYGLSGALLGDFFEKGNSFYKPDSAREIEKIDHDDQQAVRDERRAQLQKREWFSKIGKRELEIAKAEAGGHMAEARGIQDELTAVQEYQRLDKAGANDQEIHEGVVAKLQNVQRERAGQLARLVTARDGVADTAAVAREAMRFRSAGSVEHIWDKIHGTMKQHHSEAINAVTQHKFSRPS